MDNYLQQRIQFLIQDRQQKITDRLNSLGYDLTNEQSVKNIRTLEKGQFEYLFDGNKPLMAWSISPKIIDSDINFDYILDETHLLDSIQQSQD